MGVYGIYLFYPLMYCNLFILRMVGYNKVGVRRGLALVLYVFKLMRGKTLQRLLVAWFCVPDRCVACRCRPQLFIGGYLADKSNYQT